MASGVGLPALRLSSRPSSSARASSASAILRSRRLRSWGVVSRQLSNALAAAVTARSTSSAPLAGHLGDHLVAGRVDDVERLARWRVDELAADELLVGLHSTRVVGHGGCLLGARSCSRLAAGWAARGMHPTRAEGAGRGPKREPGRRRSAQPVVTGVPVTRHPLDEVRPRLTVPGAACMRADDRRQPRRERACRPAARRSRRSAPRRAKPYVDSRRPNPVSSTRWALSTWSQNSGSTIIGLPWWKASVTVLLPPWVMTRSTCGRTAGWGRNPPRSCCRGA